MVREVYSAWLGALKDGDAATKAVAAWMLLVPPAAVVYLVVLTLKIL